MAFAVASAREEASSEPFNILIGIADSASGGVLFYTACFATLEGGVWLMVLARQLYRKMEADRIREEKARDEAFRAQDRQEGREEALRLLRESGVQLTEAQIRAVRGAPQQPPIGHR